MSKLFEKFLDYKMSDEAKGKIGDLADKASEVKTELKSDFKGVREGNLRRKANKILANAESEGRAVSAQEQDRLKDLKSKAMSAEARQGKRDERYAESKARTDLKRQSYVNKMVKKGIMTAEQAKGRFDNIKGITANSAKLVNKLSNQKTKSEQIEENSSDIASESVPTPEELATMAHVDTNSDIGDALLNTVGFNTGTGILGKK